MDAFFQGFDECILQLKELDLNFVVEQLKRRDKAKDDEEEKEKEGESEK